MSEHKPKPGYYTVWKNDKYEVGGNQPYASGKGIDLNGNPVEVAVWVPKLDKISDRAFNITIRPDNHLEQNKQTKKEEEPTDLPF